MSETEPATTFEEPLPVAVLPDDAQPWQGVPFEPDHWKRADERERFDMLPDLVANHLCRGMTGTELEALVGPLSEGWSDEGADSYVFWVERPAGVAAHAAFPLRDSIPVELRTVMGLRLVLERDRLQRWELIKP